MANEITLTTTIRWTRGGAVIQASNTETITQVGSAAIENVQTVGTTSEAIDFGDVTDPAYIYFKNLDETHDVYLGTVTPMTAEDASVILSPGGAARVTTGGSAWYGKAETAAVNVIVIALQR
jgi:hypothetical protein